MAQSLIWVFYHEEERHAGRSPSKVPKYLGTHHLRHLSQSRPTYM